jgi:hypothetical protein
MEWLVLCAIVILIVLFEKWTRVQVERLNNSVVEIDDLEWPVNKKPD